MELTEQINQVKAAVLGEIGGFKGQLDGLQKQHDDLQRQTDCIDMASRERIVACDPGADMKSILTKIQNDPGFEHLQKSGRGRAIIEIPNPLEMKTVTSGTIVPSAYDAGIGDSGRKLYGLVRRLMRSIPIETGSAAFIKETAVTDAASPQTEGSAKGESNFTFEPGSAPVRTIAHWCGVSKQVLDDIAEMGEFLRTSLVAGLERETEEQILAGDGQGQNLEGLVTTATPFDVSILSLLGSWNRADVLRAAVLQLAEAGYGCTGFVTSPRDWFVIETMKNAAGDYLVGSARGQLSESLWARPVIPSPAMAAGTFLGGDFESGAHLRMRQEATIDISDSHSDYFIRNLLACRAELRAALVVKKPGAFVYGSLVSSPA